MAMRVLVVLLSAVSAARQRLDMSRKQHDELLYRPSSVEEAWDNHFTAFGAQDVQQIMLDYDESSRVLVYDVSHPDSGVSVMDTPAKIQSMFEGLFQSLADRSEMTVPYLYVSGDDDDDDAGGYHQGKGGGFSGGKGGGHNTAGKTGQVFLVWNSPTDGFLNATDTFIFDDDFKIRRQNIVIKTAPVQAPLPATPQGPALVSTSWDHDGVTAAWTNHINAFNHRSVHEIMADYDDYSIVRLWDNNLRTMTVKRGRQEIRGLFVDLFAGIGEGLTDVSVVDVDVAGDQVFLIWQGRGAGFMDATDTFIFDGDGKIRCQNIVVNSKWIPTSVQLAWDNHLQAFGRQDLNQILLDYDAQSIIEVHDVSHPDVKNKYEGPEAIRGFFAGLFDDLSDRSQLGIPYLLVEEEPAQVFLVWHSPTDGYVNATDTFIFDDSFRIRRQNIVVKTIQTDTSSSNPSGAALVSSSAKNPNVVAAWENHFSAFGSQNNITILDDYDADSIIRVFGNADESIHTYTGLEEIGRFFTELYVTIGEAAVSAPLLNVDAESNQVFLVWKAPTAGIIDATDTFIFDSNGKIRRQNIVTTMRVA